jgi:hypothetical protein
VDTNGHTTGGYSLVANIENSAAIVSTDVEVS